MKILHRVRLWYRNRRRRGFTLIEVLMAMMVTGAFSGLIITSVVNAMNMRQKALNLNRAATLGKKKMHEIKALNKTDSGRGDFQGFPGFSYNYVIDEQELDLQKMADSLGAGKSVDDSAAAKYFKEHNSGSRSATGLAFKLLHFHVDVDYSGNQRYSLDYYRGLGF
ncbi:MAG: prepilin-type N-terminal cleavage/methylation domain-containing protein [Spirochaetes bacterium]|nr:prepilin-type N-terminal cleavage/methylation domain-containing protein [Spirochaetota bacterium]